MKLLSQLNTGAKSAKSCFDHVAEAFQWYIFLCLIGVCQSLSYSSGIAPVFPNAKVGFMDGQLRLASAYTVCLEDTATSVKFYMCRIHLTSSIAC